MAGHVFNQVARIECILYWGNQNDTTCMVVLSALPILINSFKDFGEFSPKTKILPSFHVCIL